MRLPETVSAAPGPIRLWPPQIGIADAITDPTIERITLVKPVRVGFSTLLTATLASFIANEPSPILLLLPTEADCRDVMVSDLEPIFSASPTLQGLLSSDSDEGGRNTLLSRRFPGGSLKVVAAKSPRNLRRHNVRILLCDEVDGMESGPEGSPIVLAEKRTLSFANRKIIIGSTPVYEATSHVLRSYENSDKRVFECPCPECGEFKEILWNHIQWDVGKPETAAFCCPHCGAVSEESKKAGMVSLGRWRITAPEVIGHAGFRMNALISLLPNASWGKLAQEFLAAKKYPDLLQGFVNTILGQGWKESAEELDENELAARAEDFSLSKIPAEVIIVTAGVDVQRDRLEILFLGHTASGDVLVLGQSVIWGPPDEDHVWGELDDALKTAWPHANGGTLRVDACAVDSGDGMHSDKVLNYCRSRFARRVVAIKGVPGNRPHIQASQTQGSKLFIVGVDGLKTLITTRLSRGRSIRFSNMLEPRFFEELASERLIVRYVRGAPARQWMRTPGRRAESLDCLVYGLAARNLVNIDTDRRTTELATAAAPTRQSPAVVRSKWLAR
ncbi:phage terminase large subunit family protein [Corticibacterium sp. UT-5YL-CI-8]|nr:phage terminase large subunit family protein [Tianweitania sp. UT-5YL-CI-8]